jgi:hypothetical protein
MRMALNIRIWNSYSYRQQHAHRLGYIEFLDLAYILVQEDLYVRALGTIFFYGHLNMKSLRSNLSLKKPQNFHQINKGAQPKLIHQPIASHLSLESQHLLSFLHLPFL